MKSFVSIKIKIQRAQFFNAAFFLRCNVMLCTRDRARLVRFPVIIFVFGAGDHASFFEALCPSATILRSIKPPLWVVPASGRTCNVPGHDTAGNRCLFLASAFSSFCPGAHFFAIPFEHPLYRVNRLWVDDVAASTPQCSSPLANGSTSNQYLDASTLFDSSCTVWIFNGDGCGALGGCCDGIARPLFEAPHPDADQRRASFLLFKCGAVHSGWHAGAYAVF